MVKPKVKKSEAPETGLETSSAPCSEAPEADDNTVEEPSNKTVLAAFAALSADVNRIRSDVCATIENRITEVSATIRGEISSLNENVQKSISELRGISAVHETALKELEESASSHSDILSTLQSTVDHLTTKVKHLDEKCEDLEARSRRNNIRIIGIPEGKEGPRPREFISQLLSETLSLPEQPLIDRVHRINRQKPKPEDPPRPFILRLHYYHVREEILRRAIEKNKLEYQGRKIHIFPDFPPSVVKQRAAFTKVREMLRGRSDVRYGLIYPARLMVTHGGVKMSFTDPKEAQDYAEKHFGQPQ